jgi:hypothetical protein
MAGRIVEEAWSGNISKKSDSDSHLALMPPEGKNTFGMGICQI